MGYPLLKNLLVGGKVTLLELINREWENDSLPQSWKHSLVVPIQKQGSAGREAKDFRPISLTCCAAKITERMVNRRLMYFLESRDLLDHRQHAFRPGHGTNTYFATFGQVLHDVYSAGKHIELAALDISKAYNRAWMPDVLRQMAEWGLSGHLLHFVKNFLLDRTFQVIMGNHRSKTFREETGVPQGSVIAVTLFLIRMNNIYSGLPKEIYIFVYADDIVLITIGDTVKALRRKMSAATRAVGIIRWITAFSREELAYSHLFPPSWPSQHTYLHRRDSSPI